MDVGQLFGSAPAGKNAPGRPKRTSRSDASFVSLGGRPLQPSRLAGGTSFCPARPSFPHAPPAIPKRARLQCRAEAGGNNAFDNGDASLEGTGDLARIEQEEEEDLAQSVTLSDPDTGKTLLCGIDQLISHAGRDYLLCYPRHDPVFFAEMTDGGLLEVEDEADFRAMIPVARSVLARDNVVLNDTAFVLTVDDDLAFVAEGDDEGEMGDGVDDGGEEDEAEEDLDDGEVEFGNEDNVEVVAEFDFEDRHVLVVKPTEATLLVAERVGDEFRVLVGGELDEISGVLEGSIVA